MTNKNIHDDISNALRENRFCEVCGVVKDIHTKEINYPVIGFHEWVPNREYRLAIALKNANITNKMTLQKQIEGLKKPSSGRTIEVYTHDNTLWNLAIDTVLNLLKK